MTPTSSTPSMSSLRVSAVGPAALVEDLGRPGYGRWGVSRGGAADRRALRFGNRLVGNPEHAAGIEMLLGSCRFTAGRAMAVALTGAPAPLLVDGRPTAWATPVTLAAGAELAIGAPPYGLRCYLAVSGGIDVAEMLGSRSTDPTAGLGPDPLQPGDELPIGNSRGPAAGSDVGARLTLTGSTTVGAMLGPRDAHFTAAAIEALGSSGWQVSSDSDRIGIRLAPAHGGTASIERRSDAAQLASEPVVRGSIQVPPSGEPLVFLADHPPTGGYPVIAVVDDADTDLLAQARPGEIVRFRLRRTAS